MHGEHGWGVQAGSWYTGCMLLTSANDLQKACTSALWAMELAPGQHLGVLPSEQCSTNKVYRQITT